MNQRIRPIQEKITRAILVTSTVVLLLTGLTYLTYEFFTFRETTIERISIVGEVIANNSTAALAFDSQEDAYEILSALRAEEDIVTAIIFDEEGNLFAQYPRDSQTDLPQVIKEKNYFFEELHLEGYEPVILGQHRIGTLYLKYDLRDLSKQLLYFGLIALVIFLVSLLLAWLLSSKLQQRISRPIIVLAGVARAIAINKDYSVRAEKQSKDEIGLLTDAFNQMLSQIESQSIALQESEEFSRTLLESSPDCVRALDLQGNLISINPQGLEMLEIDDLEKYRDRSWESFWNEGYKLEAVNALEEARMGKIGHFQAFSPTVKGNLKWWDVLVSPVHGADGKVERLISVSRDITKMKELEQQKDDFIGIASHELKTPVTSIKAYTQVLQLHFEDVKDQEAAVMLSKMDGQIDRLTLLISDLLDVTKIEQGKLQFREELFSINDLAKEVSEEIQRTTKKHNINLELNQSPLVRGDRDRIGQVLRNFLTNAIKYSPKKEEIQIKTEVIEGREIIVSVQDHGLGLSKEDHQKVFERFYRVKSAGFETFSGLGLGLYICAEIIYRHNGRIWVESVIGKGSVFYFSLPLIDE